MRKVELEGGGRIGDIIACTQKIEIWFAPVANQGFSSSQARVAYRNSDNQSLSGVVAHGVAVQDSAVAIGEVTGIASDLVAAPARVEA
jgi:hypothetical protein